MTASTHSARGVFAPDEEIEEESSPKHDRGVESGREHGRLLPVCAFESAVETSSMVARDSSEGERGEGEVEGEGEGADTCTICTYCIASTQV